MPAASLRPPRPALALVGGTVLVLHALLLLLLSSLGAWRDRGPAEKTAPPLTVWLLDERPAAAATPSSRTPTSRVPSTAAQPRPALPRPQRAAEPGAITLPAWPAAPQAPALSPSPSPTPTPAAEQPAAPASSSAALNLALPRGASAPWRQRNPALDDARSNTRRPKHMTALIERALGGDPDGPITEEALSDGSRRFRRGRSCVVIHPSQTQLLDPFNSSYSPKPGVVDSC